MADLGGLLILWGVFVVTLILIFLGSISHSLNRMLPNKRARTCGTCRFVDIPRSDNKTGRMGLCLCHPYRITHTQDSFRAPKVDLSWEGCGESEEA